MNKNGMTRYEIMTQTPVSKLVVTLGIPTTISMLVTNLYNLADTYFVGTLGTSASAAIGIVFSLMSVIQAIGFLLGQGSGSTISRLLGAKKTDEAGVYASTAFFYSVYCGVALALVGIVFIDPFMRLLGSTATILPYARTYGICILIAAPAMTSGFVMNNILRFEGRASLAMIGLVSGGLINIAGDALTIGLLGMGIIGAGISTALSQYISAGILLSMFLRDKTQSKISSKRVYYPFSYHIQRKKAYTLPSTDVENPDIPPSSVLYNIFTVGLPSLARQGLGSAAAMILNHNAAPYGDAAIAAMSIVSRVSFFIFAVGLGIGQGFQPVCGFNYGAGKYDRVRKAAIFTLVLGTGVLSVFAVSGLALSGQIIRMFRDDTAVVSIGTPALIYQCIALITVPVSVCGNMLFQSIGKSGRAFFLSCLRNGLCFIPTLLILSHTLGLMGIQIAQPIADVISAAITLPFFIAFLRKCKSNTSAPSNRA